MDAGNQYNRTFEFNPPSPGTSVHPETKGILHLSGKFKEYPPPVILEGEHYHPRKQC